jgi:predicted DCC family thiol-disulfide oxidoreductase YuxK
MLTDERSIIFFDGECNLCNGFVQLVLKNEKSVFFYFSSLQSHFSKEFFIQNKFNANGLDSVIVYHNKQFYSQSKAAFTVVRNLHWPYRALLVLNVFPTKMADFFYQLIAKYRFFIFGKTNTCWVMTEDTKTRFL